MAGSVFCALPRPRARIALVLLSALSALGASGNVAPASRLGARPGPGPSLRPRPAWNQNPARAAPRLALTARTLARPEDLGEEASTLDAFVRGMQSEAERLALAREELPASVLLLALQLLPVLAILEPGLRLPALSYGYFGLSAVASGWVAHSLHHS
ncbi:hypothetical protein T492DRAFT_869242 [Pavlovales sp. CCMP2436]|nr:hypothetical protein T492DRAFT_869242 [Pavlovales sp. CCMP2436]